ncbi:hypothetical protein ZTR_04927 [Talaromyces verruculosus]|nr:hypothetical protein ZTR_04927 [Talaromyces verruculosus]
MERTQSSFRDYIPPRDVPRSQKLTAFNTYQWAADRCAEPFMIDWVDSWKTLLGAPYVGISADGRVDSAIHQLASEGEDLGAPVERMVEAAKKIIALASPSELAAMNYTLDADEWRSWINPEIYVFRHGIRFEEVSPELIGAVHGLLQESLSPSGYAKARSCMKINGFLGEVVKGEGVLNENSYNFSMFGTPSTDKPWGWQLFGHHLCMNCLVIGHQMVVSPVFMGAEPNIIDEGPEKGIQIFTEQEAAGLATLRSLDDATRAQVVITADLSCSTLPHWRYHRADQRHLGGAFQDNRIIPYEGALVSTFSPSQQELVRQIIRLSLDYLPVGVLQVRLAEIDKHWKETYFAWIGGCHAGDVFYYSVHSPVVFLEFDHHSGVFLSNKEPLPFHIHTLVRTPNGNDYGKELIRQYRKKQSSQIASAPE